MINPLNIAAASDAQLASIYAATLGMILIVAAIALAIGPRAPHRRHWARSHPAAFATLLAVLWVATLFGGSKTNQPPVIVVPRPTFHERLYWDADQNRYLPALIPLRSVAP